MKNNFEETKMKNKRFLGILCISTFIITALTSIPLFVSYIKGVSPQFALFTDLHVWFGLAFIIFVLFRIISNRQFVKAMFKGGK